MRYGGEIRSGRIGHDPPIIALLLGILLLAVSACEPSHESPEEVRQALTRAGILGQSPAVVEDRLRRLVLPSGSRLAVDRFYPRLADTSLEERMPGSVREFVARENAGTIDAQTRDGRLQPRKDWNVDVIVRFDSALKAVKIETIGSAFNPL